MAVYKKFSCEVLELGIGGINFCGDVQFTYVLSCVLSGDPKCGINSILLIFSRACIGSVCIGSVTHHPVVVGQPWLTAKPPPSPQGENRKNKNQKAHGSS